MQKQIFYTHIVLRTGGRLFTLIMALSVLSHWNEPLLDSESRPWLAVDASSHRGHVGDLYIFGPLFLAALLGKARSGRG